MKCNLGNKLITWISVSDLMTGLMMIFLLLALSYMRVHQKNLVDIQNLAAAYIDMKNDIHKALVEEFKDDLDEWGANIDPNTGTITFVDPEVLFQQGSSELSSRFKKILTDFFPRYIRVLSNPKFESHLSEIRIEGHTSSEWTNGTPEIIAYINNMELSQSRTRSVLSFLLNRSIYTQVYEYESDIMSWIIAKTTANGMSSSRLITDSEGKENPSASRRVAFGFVLDAETNLELIIK